MSLKRNLKIIFCLVFLLPMSAQRGFAQLEEAPEWFLTPPDIEDSVLAVSYGSHFPEALTSALGSLANNWNATVTAQEVKSSDNKTYKASTTSAGFQIGAIIVQVEQTMIDELLFKSKTEINFEEGNNHLRLLFKESEDISYDSDFEISGQGVTFEEFVSALKEAGVDIEDKSGQGWSYVKLVISLDYLEEDQAKLMEEFRNSEAYRQLMRELQDQKDNDQ